MNLSGNPLAVWRTLIFGAALLAIAICATTQYWAMSKLHEVAIAFRHGDTVLALATEDMRDEVLQLRRYEKDVLLNIGSPELVQSYQAKWQDAFLQLRYDLARVRRATPGEADSRLQEVVDSMEVYRTGFLQTYEQIRTGTLSTPQQANADADRFRDAAHNAERTLTEISEGALGRTQTVDPALVAQRWSLAASLALLLALLGLLLSGVPHLRSSWISE
jgi:methyl-accepting chemotaxis protein